MENIFMDKLKRENKKTIIFDAGCSDFFKVLEYIAGNVDIVKLKTQDEDVVLYYDRTYECLITINRVENASDETSTDESVIIVRFSQEQELINEFLDTVRKHQRIIDINFYNVSQVRP